MRRTFVTSLIVALGLVGFTATSASAQVVGNPFAIDGIITDTNNSGISGAYTVPPCDPPSTTPPGPGPAPQACKQVDPNGNAQELGPVNGSGTKIGVINTAAVNMLGTTNPNAQTDLNAAWIHSKIASVGGVPHVFLYFGWRRDSANGSGFISLEIQKAPAGGPSDGCNYDSPTFDPTKCNPWAGRQAGDIIFLWDQSGSSTAILAAPITGPSGFGQNLNVPDCSHSLCDDLTVANKAQAVFGTDCGTGFAAGQCGEMVVDLTALGVFPESPTSCVGIANFIPGTVTGNSNTADYKDVILAPFPPISNCGSITVTKQTVAPDGTTFLIDTTSTVFGYTIARGGVALRFAGDAANHPEDGSAPQLQIVRPNLLPAPNTRPGLTGCVNTTTCGGPVQTHTELIAGTTYTLAESAVSAPWTKLSIKCTSEGTVYTITASGTFPVVVNSITACVIVNQLQLGSPASASVQSAKVADSIQLSGITAGGASKASPALARNVVRLRLYTGACGTTGTQIDQQDLTLTFDPPVSGTQTAFTGFSLDKIVAEGLHYWSIQWDGDTFNNPITVLQSCSNPAETVAVDFTPNQP